MPQAAQVGGRSTKLLARCTNKTFFMLWQSQIDLFVNFDTLFGQNFRLSDGLEPLLKVALNIADISCCPIRGPIPND